MTRVAEGRSLSALVAVSGPEGPEPLAGAMPGREGLVRARLSHLLASLGDLPAQHPALAFDRPPGFGRLLDEICPAGSVVMHSRRVPNRALALDHLVIVPRGLVVVGTDIGQALRSGFSQRGATWHASENLGRRDGTGDSWARRPGVVREALRRGYALHGWLAGTPWAEVPVFVAACSAPVMGVTQKPPLMLEGFALDGLWLGAVNQLPEWLASGGSLDSAARAALVHFLAEELPVG